MLSWFRQVDEILRGEKTRAERMESATLDISAGGIAVAVVVLAGIYGLFMGSFALARGIESGNATMLNAGWMQMMASTVKMPLLFMCTLGITFPSLYVFNALVGSRLRVAAVLKLLIAALVVNVAVLASLGPIVAFFSVSTPNYPFVLLLNVAVCAGAGLLGLAFLFQTLHRLSPRRDYLLSAEPIDESSLIESESKSGPLIGASEQPLGRHVKKVFFVWLFVFGVVGAQMGWVLRPFVGSPNMEFQWLRPRDSNFFEAVSKAFWSLMS